MAAEISNLGKLFNQLLLLRLEQYCATNKIMNKCQISGSKGARTADHLMVVRFLIDKYVKLGKNKLFCCFVDLKRAFDTVNRSKIMYKLLTEYKIGGKFLKILEDIYKNSQVHIDVAGGLSEPFITHIGAKQGCV